MEKVSFFVISHSALTRIIVGNMFLRHDDIEVLGSARYDDKVFDKISKLKPDVIALELDQYTRDVMAAFEALKKDFDFRLLILIEMESDLIKQPLLMNTEIIQKPPVLEGADLKLFREQLLQNTLAICEGRGRAETVINEMLQQSAVPVDIPPKLGAGFAAGNRKKLVCIGTSTGGPKALQAVLSNIPKDIRAPIVIVQHMPPNFTKSLANRLDSACAIRVKEAEEGEFLHEGTAYIAPGGHHMTFKQESGGTKVRIVDSQPINGHRPSVDVMFSSASQLQNYDKIAVIMTGMGADGAQGLVQLKKTGNVWAIAESEESCIVFGMPKAAIQTNMIDTIQKLDHIASAIMNFLE